MFKDGYVVSVLRRTDNVPVREVDGKVHLPFETEYNIRLRNRNSWECVCELWLDGRKVMLDGRFVVPANGYLDVERFVEESLKEGKRFKFVPLTDKKVNDPGEPENGWIEARFYRVRSPIIYDIHTPERRKEWRQGLPRRRSNESYPYWPVIGNSTITPYTTLGVDNSTVKINDATFTTSHSFAGIPISSKAGATVEGSQSDQEFVTVSKDVDESSWTVIRLKIEGISQQEFDAVVLSYCSSCGEKVDHKDNFCGKCGSRLK